MFTPSLARGAELRGQLPQSRPETEARAADEALLVGRLKRLGVRRPIVVHENRTVMVSVGRSGQLRIHRGYAYSSDHILKAIIKFVNAKNRAARSAAEREVLSFSVETYLPLEGRRRRRTVQPRDRELVAELGALHEQFNAELFGDKLSTVPFRISNRMRTRLGEVTVAPRLSQLVEITISRQHWERDGRNEVEQTLLHEMIHQWQAESGRKVDHGVSFRRKAREIGVAPVARRSVERTGTATKQY
jgi:predicted SprT family Zn-dependent metalloprotease